MGLNSTIGSAKNHLLVKNHFSLYRVPELSYMVLWRLNSFIHYSSWLIIGSSEQCMGSSMYRPLTGYSEPYKVL